VCYFRYRQSFFFFVLCLSLSLSLKMFGRGAPRCPRCNDNVYTAEEIIGAGRSWHTQCFTCKSCKTRLSSTTLSDKDGEIYCTGCYAKSFGPKGFGIGGTSVQTGVSVADKATCLGCGSKNQSGKFCGQCGTAFGDLPSTSTTTATTSSNNNNNSSGVNYSSQAPKVQSYKPTYVTTATTTSNTVGGGAFGRGDICGKCGKKVYFAESTTGAGKIWHTDCFKCETCNTRLNSLELQDKDGRLFCKACYAKNFGPKGYGFGGGGATVLAYTK